MEESYAGAPTIVFRELKIAAMSEIESGKGIAGVARMFRISPQRLGARKGERRAEGELAFPGNGSRPQSKLIRWETPGCGVEAAEV